MASIRFSALVGSAVGSVGGLTLRTGRGGPVISSRARPTLPASAAQADAQAKFETVHRAWSALSAAQKLSWTTAAAATTRTNRVGLTRPRTARETYFATAMPMCYAGITLPTTYALPVYSQPYTTVRAVAIGTEEIYVSMDSLSIPTGHAFSVYGGRTFSGDVAGATPRMRHLVSTTAARCYIDIRTAFLSHFGQPAIGERLAFRLVHWTPGATTQTSWPITCNVLNRGPVKNANQGFEGAWVGQAPLSWNTITTYTPLKVTTNPMQSNTSWNLSVNGSSAACAAWSTMLGPLTAGHVYEARILLALNSGTISVFRLYDAAFTSFLTATSFTTGSQKELTYTFTATGWTGTGWLLFQNNANLAGNFTVDNISIREVL